MQNSLQKKLIDYRLFLIITASVMLLLNSFTLIMMIVAGYEAYYYVCPILMVILDAFFILLAFQSNFKFLYARVFTIVYGVGIIALSGIMIAIHNPFGSQGIFTTASCIANLIYHIISGIMIFLLKGTAREKTVKNTVLSSIYFGFSALFALNLMIFTIIFGVYGQGKERNFVYQYDQNGEGYRIVNVLCGKGDTVTIPESFNGRKVLGINAVIFCRSDIDNIVFTSADYKIYNDDYLCIEGINDNITIKASKDSFTEVQKLLFSILFDCPFYSDDNAVNNSINKINNLELVLEEDDDFSIVSFSYDYESLCLINSTSNLLPVMYGKKGDKLSTYNGYKEYSSLAFTSRSEITDDNLIWNYENNNKVIVRGLTEIDGDNVYNEANNKYQVSYEIINALRFDDNDLVYSLPDSVIKTGKYNKLVTKSTINDVINSIPNRDGFSYELLTSTSDSFDTVIPTIGTYRYKTYDIDVVYTMLKPTINSFTTIDNKKIYTYGDKVEFTNDVESSIDEFELSYSYINKYGVKVEPLFNKVVPSNSGEYKLVVTQSSKNSSLTSTQEEYLTIQVDKRVLDINYTLPQSNIYDKTNKVLTGNVSGNLAEDDVTVEYNMPNMINAGEYSIIASLKSPWIDYYTLSATEYKYEVLPLEVLATWGNTEFTYNGSKPAINISYTDIDSKVVNYVSYSLSNGVNAITEGTVTCSSLDTNYKITNNTHSYIMHKANYDMTNVSITDKSYVYDGNKHSLVVSGELPTGKDSIKLNVSYSGSATYVDDGKVLVTAIFETNSTNYNEPDSISAYVSITPAELTITWDTLTFTYDGQTHEPKAIATGVKGEAVEFTYVKSNSISKAGDSATFTATPKSNNYTVANPKALASIIKADYDMSGVSAKDSTAIYDGNNHSAIVVGTLPTGIDGIRPSMNFTGTAKNVSDGKVTVKIEFTTLSTNYNAPEPIYGSITILPLDVEAVWSDYSYTYDGMSHTARAKVTGVKNTAVSITVTGSKKNVLDTTVATVSTTDTNYNITNPTHSIEILPKEVEVLWSNYTYTYDGKMHSATAAFTDINGSTVKLTVEGEKKNVNDTVEAKAISANPNYKLLNDTHAIVINKADITGITFVDKKVTYNPNSTAVISITGTLPTGVAVKYSNNTLKNAGSILATASFTDSTGNYNKPADMTATLTVNKAVITLSDIKYSDKEVTYDGNPQRIEAILPNNEIRVSYSPANEYVDAGVYEVTATFTSPTGNYEVPSPISKNLTIKKATITAVSFNDKKVDYNGTEYEIAITDKLPNGVTVAYSNNKHTNAGSYLATATLTDSNNNYEDLELTATLTINKAKYDTSKMKFNNVTITYTTTPDLSAVKVENIPDGVTVSYVYRDSVTNYVVVNPTTPGVYKVKAVFTVDDNHEPIETLEAEVTLTELDI